MYVYKIITYDGWRANDSCENVCQAVRTYSYYTQYIRSWCSTKDIYSVYAANDMRYEYGKKIDPFTYSKSKISALT